MGATSSERMKRVRNEKRPKKIEPTTARRKKRAAPARRDKSEAPLPERRDLPLWAYAGLLLVAIAGACVWFYRDEKIREEKAVDLHAIAYAALAGIANDRGEDEARVRELVDRFHEDALRDAYTTTRKPGRKGQLYRTDYDEARYLEGLRRRIELELARSKQTRASASPARDVPPPAPQRPDPAEVARAAKEQARLARITAALEITAPEKRLEALEALAAAHPDDAATVAPAIITARAERNERLWKARAWSDLHASMRQLGGEAPGSAAYFFDAARGGRFVVARSSKELYVWVWTEKGSTILGAADGLVRPLARSRFAAAYDPARGQVIVVGGRSDAREPLAETWVWDFASDRWKKHEGDGPGALFDAAAAYDAKRREVVLFGGSRDGKPSGETWTWDGERWSLRPETKGDRGAPRARFGHAMTWDARRGVVALVSGRDERAYVGDTWSWDGERWTPHLIREGDTVPAGREGSALAFDPATGELVLFGGSGVKGDPAKPFGDLWSYDGYGWRERKLPATPSARLRAHLYFDSARKGLVLEGGFATPTHDVRDGPFLLGPSN